jgi:hypothetical protein
MAGLVMPWMLSRSTLRWRLAPPLPRPLPGGGGRGVGGGGAGGGGGGVWSGRTSWVQGAARRAGGCGGRGARGAARDLIWRADVAAGECRWRGHSGGPASPPLPRPDMAAVARVRGRAAGGGQGWRGRRGVGRGGGGCSAARACAPWAGCAAQRCSGPRRGAARGAQQGQAGLAGAPPGPRPPGPGLVQRAGAPRSARAPRRGRTRAHAGRRRGAPRAGPHCGSTRGAPPARPRRPRAPQRPARAPAECSTRSRRGEPTCRWRLRRGAGGGGREAGCGWVGGAGCACWGAVRCHANDWRVVAAGAHIGAASRHGGRRTGWRPPRLRRLAITPSWPGREGVYACRRPDRSRCTPLPPPPPAPRSGRRGIRPSPRSPRPRSHAPVRTRLPRRRRVAAGRRGRAGPQGLRGARWRRAAL